MVIGNSCKLKQYPSEFPESLLEAIFRQSDRIFMLEKELIMNSIGIEYVCKDI